jgi:outer membrane murein-binding lipoprotein Lpp
MTQNQPDRLDRIEAILLQTATQQQASTDLVAAVTSQIDQLTTKVDNLTQDVDYLREIILYNIELTQANREQADRDRDAFREEIRRIWEYLLRASGNGNTPPSA